ncbi:hypothetical protein [Endozoicomonas lisbonensis]|uniref:Protein kinase domain-containing protein n=1 Tax=Endozoicomonas lisbonensis TaxID=3120522 RepID=A0ABV2SEN0_9GAMM
MDGIQRPGATIFPSSDAALSKLERSASWLSLQVEKTAAPERYTSVVGLSSESCKKSAGSDSGVLSTKRPIELKKTKPKKPVNFDSDEVAGNCQRLIINDKVIERPRNGSELNDYMKKIAAELKPGAANAPDNTISFRYGDNQSITFKSNLLGIGSNSGVYEVISQSGDEPGKVIKITHPNDKSLNSVLKDIESSKFWMECKPGAFSVPEYLYCDPAGMFRLAEKSEGVSLTKVLLELGIYGFNLDNPTDPTIYLNVNRLMDASVMDKLEPVAEAVMEMLQIMKENPDHYTSLSPENIHVEVEYESGEIKRIGKIELIDIGINKNRKEQYINLCSFEGYLGYMFSSYRLGRYLTDKNTREGVEALIECQRASSSASDALKRSTTSLAPSMPP